MNKTYFSFNSRMLMAFSHDVCAAAFAWYLAYWLRFNLDVPNYLLPGMLLTSFWVVPLQAILFQLFGLYRGIWRYASIPDLQRILFSVLIGALATPTLLVFVGLAGGNSVPRSIFLLDPILLVAIMGGSRFIYRAWSEYRLYGHGRGEAVLVLGAGDVAVNLLKEISRSQEWRVVGLLDDDPNQHGSLLQGVKVLGGVGEVGVWAKALKVKQVIIALPAAAAQIRRRVVDQASKAGLNVLTVPAFDDLLSGKVTVSQIRKVELEDLLGRERIDLDDAGLHQLLTDKAVLITGAGGSIGSELCRQIIRFQPRLLILFELNEFALYAIEQEISARFPDILIKPVIGDVKNSARVQQVLCNYRPSVIFHAAAYKHVPLMEEENAWEAVLNNVLGTYTLASAAVEHDVENFVFISTDKAVNPANVMGATKRLAEMLCQVLQQRKKTRFVMVRFGNVLGSAGSVIPKFREQIARGGPLTVTHAEITRFFMSIPEAAQLVMQAGLMGAGGEIFVMDMGQPVKIADLAKDMIKLSGFTEDDIKIIFTGLRPGEKLYEELLADGEHTLPTLHPKLRIAEARQVDLQTFEAIMRWLSQPALLSDEQVREDLKKWIPEYLYVDSAVTRPAANQNLKRLKS